MLLSIRRKSMIYARCMYDWSKRALPARYRLVVFGQPVASWREALTEARDDAADLGHATRDRDGMFYLNGYADIWCVRACAATEKDVQRQLARRHLAEVADLSRQRAA